jgi:hypothetical protein
MVVEMTVTVVVIVVVAAVAAAAAAILTHYLIYNLCCSFMCKHYSIQML